MNRIQVIGMFAALALLTGCEGPREDAGERADAKAGVVSSGNATVKGPAERAGEAQDRVAETPGDAREARAQADSKADTLDDRAAATRGK